MREGPDIAGLAAVIGDPARANMLGALMSGMALTAGELAREAAVSPQTASAHLARLTDAGLVLVALQGRHRYYRLTGPEVAAALEGMMELAARMGRLRTRPGPRDPALRKARICYDHLAGAMGVRLYDALIETGTIVAAGDGLDLSAPGRARLRAAGLDLATMAEGGRPLCRACLDWSERRAHLAGRLGAALLQAVLGRGWARRQAGDRCLRFTPAGERAFDAVLDALRQGAGEPAAGIARPPARAG